MYDINVLRKSVYDLVLGFAVDFDTKQIAKGMVFSLIEEIGFGLQKENRAKSPIWWRKNDEPTYTFRTALVNIVLSNIDCQVEMDSTVNMLDELLEELQVGLNQGNRHIGTGHWPVR